MKSRRTEDADVVWLFMELHERINEPGDRGGTTLEVFGWDDDKKAAGGMNQLLFRDEPFGRSIERDA